MMKKFEAYYEQIGLIGAFMERAFEIGAVYEDIYGDAINQTFVSEYTDEEGKRHYENIWFFGDDFAAESKDFLHDSNFDSCMLSLIGYWSMGNKNYNFKKATSASRLTVHFNNHLDSTGILKATSENCDHLYINIFKKILLNKMK